MDSGSAVLFLLDSGAGRSTGGWTTDYTRGVVGR